MQELLYWREAWGADVWRGNVFLLLTPHSTAYLLPKEPPQVTRWWSAYRLMLLLMERPVGVWEWGVSNSLPSHLNLLKPSYKPTGTQERTPCQKKTMENGQKNFISSIFGSLCSFSLSEMYKKNIFFSASKSWRNPAPVDTVGLRLSEVRVIVPKSLKNKLQLCKLGLLWQHVCV